MVVYLNALTMFYFCEILMNHKKKKEMRNHALNTPHAQNLHCREKK